MNSDCISYTAINSKQIRDLNIKIIRDLNIETIKHQKKTSEAISMTKR